MGSETSDVEINKQARRSNLNNHIGASYSYINQQLTISQSSSSPPQEAPSVTPKYNALPSSDESDIVVSNVEHVERAVTTASRFQRINEFILRFRGVGIVFESFLSLPFFFFL